MPAGPSEISELTIVLQDQAKDQASRNAAAQALVEIAQTFPDYRGQCVAILTATLERYQRNPIELNTALISHLITLKGAESAPLVQQVVKAGEYDKSIGDWNRISRQLGVIEKRPAPAPQPKPPATSTPASKPPPSDKPPEFFSPNPAAAAATIATGPRLTPKEKDKLRAKRKQERKAKKQNRRR
jgi:hypothetical protein